MTLVDSNVILDLVKNDPHWADWSLAQLNRAAVQGPLLINDVIYAEVSVGYPNIEEFDQAIAVAGLSMRAIPRAALFLAGKVYQQYRASGGKRTGVLPDFFIGAHAATIGTPLITRDTRRYRTYFPRLALISPDA